MANIRLRLATGADFEQIKGISLDALNHASDPLFQYNFPYRNMFPDDNAYYWGLRVQPMVHQANSVVMVAETPANRAADDHSNKWRIVGWAQWVWNAPSKEEKDLQFRDSWGKAFGRLQISISRPLSGDILSQRRRDVNISHYRAFLDCLELVNDKYWTKEYPANLELGGLYVLPECQRLGIGSKLVKWGMDIAQKAGVVIGLEVVDGPKGFYEKKGFKTVDTLEVQAVGDNFKLPLHIMIWEA